MPVIEVTLVTGRTEAQLRALIESITSAVETSIGAPRENIRVLLREVPATHFAVGGVPLADTPRYHQTRPAGDQSRTRTEGSAT